MANVKKILVVDDHFEMLEFLRSMLEMSGHDYEVLAVPSAEEGFLELQRTNFDLLITDVRLPGMSGFELIRRVRRVRPDMAVIMLTAYSTAQGKKEAEELGVLRYFAKPLDTEAMLTAVHTALYGEAGDEGMAEAAPVRAPANRSHSLSLRVQHRLDSLRADTGASGLVLANLDGKILYRAGSKSVSIDLDQLVAVVARNIENGFGLAQALGGKVPFTIQYHAGDQYELYNANIGRDYFITMYFDVAARRGRIGTIWVFAQRAIKELFPLLTEAGRTAAPTAVPTAAPTVETAVPDEPQSPPPPEPVAVEADEEIDYDAERRLIDEIPSWSDLEGGDESADLDDLLNVLNLAEDVTAVDLDSFWEEAVVEPETPGSGISFEEAMKRGLISLGDETADETAVEEETKEG
jgi:DNA-binding response OmpR family regulator